MILSIQIKNFALIENVSIPFQEGLNILSGETGAGKSIVLDAISLLLGGRATQDFIRNGEEEAIVEGLFDVEQIPWIQERFEAIGIDADDVSKGGNTTLLIKRSVNRNGKNRIFINGQNATLSMLQALTEGLVDLCGQHEHQSLFKSLVQLELIDRFGGLEKWIAPVRESVKRTRKLNDELTELKQKEEERVQRLDFVRFQLQELKEAKLELGEDEKLATEKKLLQSHELRLNLANQIDTILDSADATSSISDQLKVATHKARQLVSIDESFQPVLDGLERALLELEEVISASKDYIAKDDLDPGRLEGVQSRLSLITQLKRKYGANVEDILAAQKKLEDEESLLSNLSSRVDEIEKELQTSLKETTKLGKDLFEKRKKAAALFSKAIENELKDLKMNGVSIEAQLELGSQPALWSAESLGVECSIWVGTNEGEDRKPLPKIVSGGELSRLMLAIRRVISDKGGIGVYLFDEIDAGLGGQTAFVVGKKLKSVAKQNQVICITHVPQVACFADHHLSISKSTIKGRTSTRVDELAKPARKEEIARMLGAEKITPSALKNAQELIESARV